MSWEHLSLYIFYLPKLQSYATEGITTVVIQQLGVSGATVKIYF